MIKQNQKILNFIKGCFEILILTYAFYFAYVIRVESGWFNYIKSAPFEAYLKVLYVSIAVYYVSRYVFSSYLPFRTEGVYYRAVKIIKCNLALFGVLLSYLFIFKETDISRIFLVIFAVLNILMQLVFAAAVKLVLSYARKAGYNLKYIAVVGKTHLSKEYIETILKHKNLGYKITGVFDKNKKTFKDIPSLGNYSDIDQYLKNNSIDELIIGVELNDYGEIPKILTACEKYGIKSYIIPGYTKFVSSKPIMEEIGGISLINTRSTPLDNFFIMFFKRFLDIVFSLLFIIVLSPLFAVLAVIIKATSKGTVFFVQTRVGKNKKEYKMYKFRTMREGVCSAPDTGWTVKNDTRVTNVGKFMRKLSIDELPQLYNILKGDMSFIGPRPERPYYVEKFREEIPKYNVKHFVKPGLTGWAQVNGYRGDTSIAKRIEYDIYYIENWSINLEVKILFMTLREVFTGKNAY